MDLELAEDRDWGHEVEPPPRVDELHCHVSRRRSFLQQMAWLFGVFGFVAL